MDEEGPGWPRLVVAKTEKDSVYQIIIKERDLPFLGDTGATRGDALLTAQASVFVPLGKAMEGFGGLFGPLKNARDDPRCLCARRSLGSGANCRPPRALSLDGASVPFFRAPDTAQPWPAPATDCHRRAAQPRLNRDFCSPKGNPNLPRTSPSLGWMEIPTSSSIAGHKVPVPVPATQWSALGCSILPWPLKRTDGTKCLPYFLASSSSRLLACSSSCCASCWESDQATAIAGSTPGLPGLPPFPATLRNTPPSWPPHPPGTTTIPSARLSGPAHFGRSAQAGDVLRAGG